MKHGAVDDQLCDCVGMIILHSGVWYRYTECLVYNRTILWIQPTQHLADDGDYR